MKLTYLPNHKSGLRNLVIGSMDEYGPSLPKIGLNGRLRFQSQLIVSNDCISSINDGWEGTYGLW